MRALVISGGGSKGAFAGGVAQYLIDEMDYSYDLFVGTSTGSLLISHLALDKVDKIKKVYTSVDQHSIFNSCPFLIKNDKFGGKQIVINHFEVLKNFLKGKKTFGESNNLRKLISKTITEEEFDVLKASNREVVVTVSNLSLNQVEYKSIKDFDYKDFCDWIWISSNFTPFMSLVKKDGCEYADGGFGSMVPIEEAIERGATTVDVIVLETEVTYYNRLPSKNVFSLLTNMHRYMADRIEKQNIRIGKMVATNKDVIINLYYTPTVLTTNSLIFDQILMAQWWERGFNYAKQKNSESTEIKIQNT
jgi:predicted patatin/cPLA2 family phospholipase